MKSESTTLKEDEITNLDLTQEDYDRCLAIVFCLLFSVFLIFCLIATESLSIHPHKIQEVRKIKIVSMDFAVELNDNSTTTQQQSRYLHDDLVSTRWDLLIRVPGELVGDYICLQGNLQVSFLYKNVTLVTSSMQSYNKLELGTPQLFNVSAVATKEDLSGAIGREIMDAIKERNEVLFGSRLSLTDCREETEKGTISYECDEAELRVEPVFDQIKATTAFGNHPTCIINL